MVRLQKHGREILDRLQALGLVASMESRRGSNAHYALIVEHQGVEVRLSVPSSPSSKDDCVSNMMQNVRRRFAERGVTLPVPTTRARRKEAETP